MASEAIGKEVLVSYPVVQTSLYDKVLFSSTAALSVIIWDTLLTLGDEVLYIWTKPSRSYIKWMYLFSKWLAVANQIILHVTVVLIAWNAPVPVSTCLASHWSQAAVGQLLWMNFDAMLLLRIHALYQQNFRYTAVAGMAFLLEIVAAATTDTIGILKGSDDGACMVMSTPLILICMMVGLATSQGVLLCLTYRKKSIIAITRRRRNIVWVVIRDGAFATGTVIILVAMSLLYLVVDTEILNVIYVWMPMIPSLLASRMLLNMQVASEAAPRAPEFTTGAGELGMPEDFTLPTL